MKKFILSVLVLTMILAPLAGCHNSQGEEPAVPDADPTTVLTTEPTQNTTEEVEDEIEASTHYIENVYPQQIARYYNAISQQWDEMTYLDNDMSTLAAHYYNGKALDNVGFTFMDLDGDGIWELIIGAIMNAEKNPLVFEIWKLQDGQPVMIAQSGSHNRYYLQYAQVDNKWTVAYEAENGAANHAVYSLELVNGEFKVIQGVVFDARADEENPWFMTSDLDWDVSNDTPIDEQTANAAMEASRNIYAPTEYFPYSLYN